VLVRNLTLSGTRSEHTVRVSTIYQFVTVFNHSDHALTFLPENHTVDASKHYRVPPRIYLTLPLFGAGTVESCQREVIFTVVSEGVSIAPTVIGLTFTEVNNNVNMPFPDQSATPLLQFPPSHTPAGSWSDNHVGLSGDVLFWSRFHADRTQVLTGFEVSIASADVPTTADLLIEVRVGTHRWMSIIGAGSPRGTRIGATGLYIPVVNGNIGIECWQNSAGMRFIASRNGFDIFP